MRKDHPTVRCGWTGDDDRAYRPTVQWPELLRENRYKGEALTYQVSYEQLPDGTRRGNIIAYRLRPPYLQLAVRVDQTSDGLGQTVLHRITSESVCSEASPTRHLEGLPAEAPPLPQKLSRQGQVVATTKKKTWRTMKKTFEQTVYDGYSDPGESHEDRLHGGRSKWKTPTSILTYGHLELSTMSIGPYA